MSELLPPPAREQLRIPLPERRDLWLRVCVGIHIPRPPVQRPKNHERRRRGSQDANFWCETYFPDIYFEPNEYHRRTITRLQDEILTTEPTMFKNVDAIFRGGGKTTIRRLIVLWAAMNGHEDLSVFGGYKDENAEPHLKAIKHWLFTNDLLYEDYPEICGWVRHINNDPKRAAPIPWSDNFARLPNGAWLIARGIFSGLVGINIEGKRPGIIVLDDYETVETADSAATTEDIGNLIDQQIIKLPGPRKRGVIEMLGTVRTKSCNMARYTDPIQSPGWNITRLKGLLKPPEREDLWGRFVSIARREATVPPEALTVSDETAAAAAGKKIATFALIKNEGLKNATRFYAYNKTAMDAGAQLLDSVHLSLWECYRTIAEDGLKTFQTEIQQEAWEDHEAMDRRDWNVSFIISHASDYSPLTLPHECPAKFVTMGADVHKLAIFYVFRAWDWDGTSWLIEAGVSEIFLPGAADTVQLDKSRWHALERLFEASQQGWKIGNRVLSLATGFVDEGWETNQVRAFCQSTKWLWRPIKGIPGMSHGRIAQSKEFEATINLGVYHFKHDLARLLARTRSASGYEPGFFHLNNLGAGHPGSHYQSYCKHMCSEVWQPKKNKDGTDVNEYWWETINKNNHWWDCETYSAAGAFVAGVSLIGEQPPPVVSKLQSATTSTGRTGWIREREGDWISSRD